MANDRPLPPLVSAEWLENALVDPHVRIVDGSSYLPVYGRNARREYETAHIPDAVFFDLDASSDHSAPLPHMLPEASELASRMSTLGIDDANDIIVYDGSGANLSAARVWWMFRVFGHRSVAVLDGGINAWQAEGRPLESSAEYPAVARTPGKFTARLDTRSIRSLHEMLENVGSGLEQVIDARAAARFAGEAPEPRPGMRAGHIPRSLNLPYTELVSPNGKVLPVEILREKFDAIGVDLTRRIVLTCGSGTSACNLALALELIGAPPPAVYDGSWSEWGSRSDTPVETGT